MMDCITLVSTDCCFQFNSRGDDFAFVRGKHLIKPGLLGGSKNDEQAHEMPCTRSNFAETHGI